MVYFDFPDDHSILKDGSRIFLQRGSIFPHGGEGGPTFALKITEIPFHIQADISRLTTVTGYNHEEVSTNGDTLFCVCFFPKVFLVLIFSGGSEPFQGVRTPLDPHMLLVHTD